MKRRHEMPFGAEYSDAATRFSLWAPGCGQVHLALGREGARTLPMQAADDGWHTLSLPGVKPGEAYTFGVREGAAAVPDPASRSNPWDVHAPSVVVDPGAYEWTDDAWKGRPWSEAVVYELHLGTFTPAGTFDSAIERLDHLQRLGVTAVELMPVAAFSGRRNWGYDGVLQFAPDAAYGAAEDLKRLVDECHRRGLMVLLDVVYNHFGPEGNYLPIYAPQFFNSAHRTPWGAAINFDGEHSRTVRDFFVHNTLYWLEEFHLDGLRMDAIHAIADDSPRHIVMEIAEAIAAGPGRERHVHQVLENARNEARLLERGRPHVTAQWNDDTHHAFHVLLTGETDGYYADYADRPAWHLGRTLAEGFSYQGEVSKHEGNVPRGEPSALLPREAFVQFLQNHDQVGNRALGERLTAIAPPEALRLATAALLLAPGIPLLFMGEEFAAATPFVYFCDYQGELAAAVREGRRREFASFARFRDPAAREAIPDPNAEGTFLSSKLDWDCLAREPHAATLEHHRELLALRASEIAPRLGDGACAGTFILHGACGIAVDWRLAGGAALHLRASFGGEAMPFSPVPGEVLHVEGEAPRAGMIPAWSGIWTVERA
ncbi:MAG: malto-oligosyltrehalose trehalohydrolase [Usitatibacter sp.]